MTYAEVKETVVKALALLEPIEILFNPDYDEDWLDIVIVADRFKGLAILTRIDMCLHLLQLRAKGVEEGRLIVVLPLTSDEFDQIRENGTSLFEIDKGAYLPV